MRRYARQLLGISGDGEVIPFLTRMPEAGTPPAPRPSARALGELADDTAVPLLTAAIRDSDAGTRPAPPGRWGNWEMPAPFLRPSGPTSQRH